MEAIDSHAEKFDATYRERAAILRARRQVAVASAELASARVLESKHLAIERLAEQVSVGELSLFEAAEQALARTTLVPTPAGGEL